MLFSFPLGVPKAPLRPLGNDSSLPCLSPDLDGVQLFRIHCQAAAVVRLCGLGCVTFFANGWGFGSIAKRLPLCVCAYVLGLLSFLLGVPKAPLRPLGNDRFLLCLSPDLDGVQPFRIHCQAAAVVRLCGLGCVTFFANGWGFGSIAKRLPLCVCAYVLGLLSFLLGVPKAPLRPLGNDRFFALPEPGFRWCSAVSDPLPSGCRCAFVRSRLRHVFC